MPITRTLVPSFSKLLFVCSVLSLSFVDHASAVGLSSFRIYLDSDHRSSTFRVYNQQVDPQNCALSLIHHVYDELGEMTTLPESEIPKNSAKDWIRFSPKTFSLSAANSQTVRFTLRRRANAEPGEFRAYLAVDCGPELGANTDGLISIKPKLIHNIPIIVRIGELSAEIDFADIRVDEHNVQFTITRKGRRSVFGNLALINSQTDEIVTEQKSVSIYTESKKVSFTLPTKGVPVEELKLRFKEVPAFGGELLLEKALTDGDK